MLVEDTFRVNLPLGDAWNLLTDIEQVVPCVPGARLDEVVDGEYRGRVTARIGPITVSYAGAARFVERDDVDHRAVIALRGREERGSGSVNATVTTALRPEGDHTVVDLATELDVSGKAAQFGRGILGDVATSVLGEFSSQLEQMVGGKEAGGSDGVGATAGGPGGMAGSEAAAFDMRHLLVPVLRRAAVPVACSVLSGLVGWLIGRRRCARPSQARTKWWPPTRPA